MGWKKFIGWAKPSLLWFYVMLLCCNSIVVIIIIDGTCHGQNKKKNVTMLNGKFASYKLKANSYINLGNADHLFLLIFEFIQ